jgi:hypothetical protein
MAIAIARLEKRADGMPASYYLGGVYQADVETGSRRCVSLLPVIGKLFGG